MKIKAKLTNEPKIGEIFIDGDITDDSWWDGGVDSKDVKAALDELPDDMKQLNIIVNSCGGSVTSGTMMRSLIDAKRKKCGAKIVTFNDGIAASMATMIMMMGEERHMADGALYMAHYPLMATYGHSYDHAQAAEELEAMNKTFRDMYMQIFSGTEEELDALLKEERLLTAEQALEYGFITEIDKVGIHAVACDDGLKFGNYCVSNKMVASAKGLLAYKKDLEGGENGMIFSKEQEQTVLGLFGEKCGDAVLAMLAAAKDAGINSAEGFKSVMEANAANEEAIGTMKADLETAQGELQTAKDALQAEQDERANDKKAMDELTDKLTDATAKCEAYDKVRNAAVAACKASGVKAMGEAFDEKAYDPILAGLSLDSINAMAEQFEATAATVLNAGKRISHRDNGTSVAAIDPEDYKL